MAETITDVQIANNAAAAGWTGADLVTSVAVALAESRGDVKAQHRNTNGSTDYGLWQVNSIHNYPVADLLTAMGNAKAAHEIWARDGWRAWAAHNNSSYLLFKARASKAIASTDPTVGINSPDTVTTPLEQAFKNPLAPLEQALKPAIQRGWPQPP